MREQKYCCRKCADEKRLVERKIIKQICPKCGKEFEVEITEKQYKRNKYRKFCSRECANSKNWTDDHKKKISEINKKSEKVRKANSIITENRKKAFDDGRNKRRIQTKEFICQHCGTVGFSKRNKKYHAECWLKVSGGVREGSSRSKHGWYKGIWCDSSYELAFVIYCLEHNIKIERNRIGFEYLYENEKHIFYPDFKVNVKLVEIKNFRSNLTDIKLKCVNEKIDIYYKDTIKPFLKYTKDKYGKDFISLYEKKGGE